MRRRNEELCEPEADAREDVCDDLLVHGGGGGVARAEDEVPGDDTGEEGVVLFFEGVGGAWGGCGWFG